MLANFSRHPTGQALGLTFGKGGWRISAYCTGDRHLIVDSRASGANAFNQE